MLKQVDQNRLKKLRADVDSLYLRFPVSAVAKRMGVHKGNVSAYFTGRVPLSQNFIDQFYRIFKEDLEQAAAQEATENSLNAVEKPVYDSSDDRIEILQSIENRLSEIVELLKAFVATRDQ